MKYLVVRLTQPEAAALRTYLEMKLNAEQMPPDVAKALSTLRDSYEEEEIINWGEFSFEKFIRTVHHLERRLDFLSIGYLVNKVLKEHNCGVDLIESKRKLVEYAIDAGIIHTKLVDGDTSNHKITSVALNPKHPLVESFLAKLPQGGSD